MAREIDLKVKEYITKTPGTPTIGVGPPRKSDKRVYSVAYKNGNVKFECDSRYTPIESIGTGAYGVVCAAKDNRTGRKVAIKKITKAFDVITVAKRTYRELKILRHLRHDNVISILDVMEPPDDSDQFNDVYVVLDLMESDLHHIIHSVQPLSDEHVKFFLYQICRGLKYIHSARLLHRDLKPSNLLINRNCELKIGDFGMARGMFSASDDHSSFMTEYVATRWYRAPELMLSLNEYTEAIDIWSVGCIFAEMLGRRQLFPGKNYLNQLQLILSVVGTPDDKYIQKIGSDKVKSYLKTLPSRSAIALNVLFPNADKESLVLLQKMLYLDPSDRCSAVEVLSHSYLSRYHDPADEPICTPPFDFSFEKKLLTKEALKEAFKEEILEYHKCRMPIPPNDEVKSALKKMMEEREKGVEVESKESKRKRLEDKKRKFPEGGGGGGVGNMANQVGPDKQKKRPRGSNSPLSDADKSVLEHWNKIQQTLLTRAKERLGNKADNANMEEFFQHQELLIKQQSEQLDRQQSQMMEQQRRIQQQAEQIRVLVHQQKVLIRECKANGMKIPLSTPNPSPLTPPFPTLSPNLSKTQPSTVNNVSRPTPTVSDTTNSNSKPVTKPKSPNIIVPSPPPPVPPPITHAAPPSSVPVATTKPSVSIPSVVSISSSRSIAPPAPVPPKIIPPRTTTIVTVTPPSLLHDNIVTQALPYPAAPPPSMFPHQPLPSLPPLPVYPNSGQFHQQIPPQVSMATTDYMMSQYVGQPPPPHPQQDPMVPFMNPSHIPPFTGPDFSSVFSPLTSKELMELTSQEIHNLSPCDPHSVGSFNPPFDELDNLFNLPTGCGAGYGVGVSEDDLQVSIPPNNEVVEGPQSANILEDWLVEMDRMDPQGMEALQQEMEFGASDMFFRDLDKL